MRLIDADALHKALQAKQKWVVHNGDMHNEGYTYDQVHFGIDKMPTIEAEPVRHGHWVVDEDGNIKCSECGYHGVGDNYCERCGAKMDEENR